VAEDTKGNVLSRLSTVGQDCSQSLESPVAVALGEIPHRAVSTRIEYGVEIRGCNLGAALGPIKLGKGEHLLRSGGTAGDSFVGFDGIFERYRVYSRQL
jgi:hypothetical protein